MVELEETGVVERVRHRPTTLIKPRKRQATQVEPLLPQEEEEKVLEYGLAVLSR